MPPPVQPLIRPLTPQDDAAFMALRREAVAAEPFAFEASPEDDFALDSDFVRRQLGASFAESGSVVVGAFEADRLVGMIGLFREREVKLRHKARLWGFYVRPAHRGRGLGGALLEAALGLARQLPGVERVRLSVTAPSEAAVRLYERLGFIAFGRERRALWVGGSYVDELHMVLVL